MRREFRELRHAPQCNAAAPPMIGAHLQTTRDTRAQRPVARFLPDGSGGCALALARRRRRRGVRRDGREPVRDGQAVGRGDGAAVRHAHAVAGLPAHRRGGRPGGRARAPARPAVPPPDARGAGGPSGARPHHDELRGQRARPGQRGDADRPEGDARAADAQSERDHGEQCADPVPGAQRLVADAAARHHLHVPRAAGRGRSDAGVPADPARHQRARRWSGCCRWPSCSG